jgi:hypothetical protein
MADSAIARKLQLKPGHSVLLVNAPDGFRAALDPLPDDVEVTDEPGGGRFDLVQLFARDAAELAELLPGAIRAVKDGALLWVAYPKGGKRAGTDLNRDILWSLVEQHGWAGVRLIAIDDTWSSMRFRPAGQVGA